MAKLHSYYTLCPLIDQQNLLGVESDSESGCAIVTLGRNIVIRYKLQDLKQLGSWTSKDRLTTQVIYDDSTGKYAAIFNEKKIRLWSKEDADLNAVKGFKFRCSLYTILTHEGCPPILVRPNGATASLEWALQNRKTWGTESGVLRPEEKILDSKLICSNRRFSLCILTRLESTYYCIVVRLKENCYTEELECVRRMELRRKSEELMGHTIMPGKNGAYLLTLWSHGRLYRHSLTELSAYASTLIGVIANINTKYPVVLAPLNEATVGLYGADASEEGAILMIYNVQFKLVQASQTLKLYTKDAKLWKIEDKLLLAANRHLAIAPYYLAPQKIATLLGSSVSKKNEKSRQEDDDIVVIQESTVAHWEKNGEASFNDQQADEAPGNISRQISTYMDEGLSDSAIQEMLIPQLIESKDVSAISWCLDHFRDLPEKLLTDLLIFTLRSTEKTFSRWSRKSADAEELGRGAKFSRDGFLDKIFSLAYSDVSLLSYLKMGLKFDEVLRLLGYLIKKLEEKDSEINGARQPSDKQLYEWSSLLLDAYYPVCVLSRDPEVAALLGKLSTILDEHIGLLHDLKNLRPILSRTMSGKSPKLSPKDHNKFYSIEEARLY